MSNLGGALDAVDDVSNATNALGLVELGPRRQGHQINRVDGLRLDGRRRSLPLGPTVAPTSNEKLLAQERARGMHARPLSAPRNKSLFDALSKDVSKAILLGIRANHDERCTTKYGSVQTEHGVNSARNVRMDVLNKSTECECIRNADERMPMVRHERDGVYIDWKKEQGAPEDSKNHAIQGLAGPQQIALPDGLSGDFHDEPGGNKTRRLATHAVPPSTFRTNRNRAITLADASGSSGPRTPGTAHRTMPALMPPVFCRGWASKELGR